MSGKKRRTKKIYPKPALPEDNLARWDRCVYCGKPVSPEKEGMVHFAGLVVLMVLMVFIMYNDIMRLMK